MFKSNTFLSPPSHFYVICYCIHLLVVVLTGIFLPSWIRHSLRVEIQSCWSWLISHMSPCFGKTSSSVCFGTVHAADPQKKPAGNSPGRAPLWKLQFIGRISSLSGSLSLALPAFQLTASGHTHCQGYYLLKVILIINLKKKKDMVFLHTKQLAPLYFFFLLISETEKYLCVVLCIYIFICWFLYVLWPGLEPTTLVNQENTLTTQLPGTRAHGISNGKHCSECPLQLQYSCTYWDSRGITEKGAQSMSHLEFKWSRNCVGKKRFCSVTDFSRLLVSRA